MRTIDLAKASRTPGPKTLWNEAAGRGVARSLVVGGRLVVFRGTSILSYDLNTGKASPKAKWNKCGVPFIEGGTVWTPTTKGYDVRDPATLEVERTVATPKPKGPRSPAFWGQLDLLRGAISYRIARTTKPERVGTALFEDYLLHAYDTKAGRELFVAKLAATNATNVMCQASDEHLVMKWKVDGVFHEVVASLTDGCVLIDRSCDEDPSNYALRASCGFVVWFTGVNSPVQVWRSDWVELAFCGTLTSVDSTSYGVGHRELLRLKPDLSVAARVPLDVPPPPHDSCTPESSLALVGDDLWVLSRVSKVPKLNPRALPVLDYRLQRHDPKTLSPRGEAVLVSGIFGTRILGYEGNVLALQSGPRFAVISLDGA